MRSLAATLVCAMLAVASAATAADFRSTADAATVLYDAPSTKARPLFVYGKDVPMELLVSVEGWTKVRDNGGTIGWIASKSLSDRRMLLVRVPVADVHSEADDAAPLVFRAEQNVLLELAEPAPSAAATSVPGWVKVRHRDGQTGFVRLSQVFGL
ncbi:MAG TPA: SH3 domain-containing protein [Casimicrobiaceae bacterium]|nr:SH3 domain-containing protein [Casimicrobiaceae bacterium]